MVRSMHEAGIEVILDVVYNHTAEGNHLGPTLSFRGLDNPAYYRLVEDDLALLHGLHRHRELPQRPAPPLAAADHGLAALLGDRDARRRLPLRPRGRAGAGVLRRRPAVDVLRARAAGPGRQPGEADRRAVGRRAGRLPGRQLPAAVDGVERQAYRDTVRDFWRGEPSLGEFASRLAGSSDLYENSGRRPVASINFVTAHDGFTLRDLVSYNDKHNEANGEDGNDGESHNRSWNHGVEGPTDDPEILELRSRAAAQLHRHAAAQPGRADAAARRRGRPHPGRQQQHLRPGLRDRLDALGRRRRAAGGVHRRASPGCAATTRRSAASASSPARRSAPAAATASASTTSSGCTPTATRWRTATGPRRRPGRSACTSTATASPGTTPAAARSRRPLPALLQRRGRRRTADAAAGGVRRGLGRRDRHRRHRRATTSRSRPGRPRSSAARSVLVLREHTAAAATPDSSVAASVAASRASRADKAG